MATTTNYGWTTPDDTALVKDGAAAIRTLGSSIDSTLKTQIDAQIPDSLLTTKGDLIAATGASTPARLAAGTDGLFLKADSTQSTGLAWGAAGGSLTLSTIASGSLTSGTSLTLSSLSTYDTLILIVNGVRQVSDGFYPYARINANSGGNYIYGQLSVNVATTSTASNYARTLTGTEIPLSYTNGTFANTANTFILKLTSCKNSGFTSFEGTGVYASGDHVVSEATGVYKVAEAVSSITFAAGNTFSGSTGTYQLIGG